MKWPNDILKIPEKCKFISFDIFDTLLIRNCNNCIDVFKYIEKKYNINNFCSKRVNAEQKARRISLFEEITLHEIYSQYSFENEDISLDELMKIEIDTEKNFLVKNLKYYELYKILLKKGYKIIITSDMYLPKNVINDILYENGYKGYFKLYLSSDLLKTKATGSMFKYILSELNIKPNEIIHFGDNIKSDFLIPKKMGIKTYLVHQKKKNHYNDLDFSIFNNFIENTADSKEYYSQFGYECFGPFLYEYVKWLKEKFIKNDISKVYFLSRDGYIMKEAFDIINNDNIESLYLEVSRRSLRVPILHINPEYENIILELSNAKSIKLINFFDMLGLNAESYKICIEKYGFMLEKNYDKNKLLGNAKFKKMYDECLKKDVIINSKKEFEFLKKYLKMKKVEGKFAIVDIGWGGSMQKYLIKTLNLLNINNDVFGYYIGIADYYKKNVLDKDMKMFGYLFDLKNNINTQDLRKPFVGLFESLFLENKGSVEKYRIKNNLPIAIRSNYEYSVKDKLINEEICVNLIQKSAINFIKYAEKNSVIKSLNIKSEDAFNGIRKVGLYPTRSDLNHFCNFRFFDEGEINRLASPKKMIYYIFHISKFKNDFFDSRWKIGFLSMAFKLKLNYCKIYKFLYKFK